jgi:phage terminase large subunit GpA-like protein
MSSAQVGKTEVLLCILGYHIHHDPAPTLLLQPTLEMAEAFSKDRLMPMIRDTPAITHKIDAQTRNSGNTILHKKFPGGHLTMAGANSPSSLASRPIRIVLCDEVDRYPASAGDEGDPVSLATKRTATFWNRKRVLTSTPTVKGVSRIERAYESSDQRRYNVPCPYCGHQHPLQWANMIWDKGQPDTARMRCPECEKDIPESAKPNMMKRGQWIAQEPFTGTAGFHLNELYSPWRKWSEVVVDFLAAKDNRELLQTWVNTSLGETWEDAGETADPESLIGRREAYPADVPDGVCVLTAGVDVQGDRLEVYVYGYGEGEETWAIDAVQLWGDPNHAEVWDQLDQVLSATYHHETGAQLPISASCIDSGGHHTQLVYDFVRRKVSRRIHAIKGMAGEGKPIVAAPSQKRTGRDMRKVPLFVVGVDSAKALIMSRLQNTHPGPGYWHIPAGHSLLAEEYVAQLTAEKLVTKLRRGFPVKEWIKTRARNEALDCAVYALAALRILNPRMPDLLSQKHEPSEKKLVPLRRIRLRF